LIVGGWAPILHYYYSFNGSPKYQSPIIIIIDVIIIDNQPSRAKIIIIDNQPSRAKIIIIDNDPSRAKSIIINNQPIRAIIIDNQPSQFEQLLLSINRAEPSNYY